MNVFKVLRRTLLPASLVLLPAVALAESTLGFVITTWHNAVYETKFIDECPTGLADGNHIYWWNSKTPEERAELTQDGLTNRPFRLRMTLNRGQNGEDICMDPTSIDFPPLRTVQGEVSFGMNLDGNTDGRATANTCQHEILLHRRGSPASTISSTCGWLYSRLPLRWVFFCQPERKPEAAVVGHHIDGGRRGR